MPDMPDLPVWTPSAPDSGMPMACPVCGSVGTARGMPDHIMAAHPDADDDDPECLR